MSKRYFVLFVFAVLPFFSCKSAIPARTEFVLGTVCTINLYDRGTDQIYAEMFGRLKDLESILSANRDDTNIAVINQNAGIVPVKANPETMAILSEALLFSEKTGGLFDPTIGPLVKAWNIGTEYAAIPSKEKLETAKALVNWKKLTLSKENGTVFLQDRGMKLDLGAIAKGFAADEMTRILTSHGIKRAIIDLGGNIYAVGEKAKGTPWVIGIRDPEQEQGESIMSIPVSNESVVTSGIYERFFMANGVRYHHILDPETGYPVNNELMSVSIIATNSMLADALSTSTFLLGTEKGMELIESTEGTEAVFINKNHEVRYSKGLINKIKLLDTRYTLAGN
jgi:FAD:protein FMN transferase